MEILDNLFVTEAGFVWSCNRMMVDVLHDILHGDGEENYGAMTDVEYTEQQLEENQSLQWIADLREEPRKIVVIAVADWGGDRTRKSTPGGIVLLGDVNGVPLRSWSRLQHLSALSSGEAEYAAFIAAVTEGRAAQALCADLGFNVPLELQTDSSAAKGSAERVGLLRMKHLELKQFYLKQMVAMGLL